MSDEFLDKTLSKTETLNTWRENYERELHKAVEIDAQLEKMLGRVVRENAAYYFRYIANSITATERDAVLQALAAQEENLAAYGSITPLGRRFVAER